MTRNRKIICIILLVVALIVITSGLSYAYFTAIGTSNEQVVESGILKLTYSTGQDITLENVFPTTEENAGIHRFAIEIPGH